MELNPKDIEGMKKAPLRLVPPALLLWTSKAMEEGAKKYGPYNWRTGPAIQLSIYIEAALRHLLAFLDGETIDPDSGLPHAAKAAACMAIILDATAINHIVDDRSPGPGPGILKILKENVGKET